MISDRLGVSEATVRWWFKQAKAKGTAWIDRPDAEVRRAEARPQVIALRARGISVDRIARELRMGKDTVKKLLREAASAVAAE